jgi:WD40 repeat protein
MTPQEIMRKILIVASLLIAASGAAQSLSVFNLDTTNFPTMKARFFAFDANGNQVNPSASEITVTEDGIPRAVTSLTCSPKKDPTPISLGIMVDTYSGIDLAKEGAQKLTNLLSIPTSEAGITMMDHGAFIVQDLTQKHTKLDTAIAKLQPAPGVDLQTMFYAPNAGGVPFVSAGRNGKKVLVLITDLHCPLFNLNKQQLYADARSQNISVYIILIGTKDEFGYSKEIADNTGGILFESITSTKQMDMALFSILSSADNLSPCELTWNTDINCDLTRNVVFTYQNNKDNATYSEPPGQIPELNFSSYGVDFGQIIPGQSKDISITITAKNLPIIITNITISDNAFKIVGGGPPPSFTLAPGQSRTLVIRYTPTDSSYKFEKVMITSNVCLANPIYLMGGFDSKKDSTVSLTVVQPNGGEKFLIGDTEKITWANTLPNDTVSISYSIDNGRTWKKITDSACANSYLWILPATPSDSCLIKIQNHTKFVLDSVKSDSLYDYGWHVAYSKDGKYALSAGVGGPVTIWDPFHGKILHTLSLTMGLDAMFSPDNSKVITTGYASTALLWDVTTGSLLKTFTGHKSDVNTVRFNIDGTRALTSSKDSTAIMWDVQTGAILTRFIGHKDWVTSAIFSPFGDKVYTSSNDGTAKIWDATTGQLLFNLIDQHSAIDDITLNHKGDLLSSVSKKNVDLVWNTIDGSLFQRYIPGWGFTKFSNDDQLLLSATNNTAYVWGVASGKLLNSYTANGSPVLCGTFNSDGKIIVTGGGSVQCWDVQSGWEILPLPGAKGVRSLDFNPIRQEIITLGPIGFVQFWYLSYRPNQNDISDAVFTIIAPTFSFSSNSIVMGKVEIGTEKDSLVKATICNNGNQPLHVLSMDVTGGATTEFMIMSGAGDFTLAPGECRDVMFTFMPMMVGKMSATVTLRTANGNYPDTIKIIGEGIAPLLQEMTNVIDFGQVKIGDFKDTTITVAIKNIGSLPINFQPSTQLGPDTKQFSLQSSNAPFTLAPSSSQSVKLRFSPRYIGRTSGRVAFAYNGPSTPAILNVYGQGIGGLVVINNDSGYAGDHKQIPMIVQNVPLASVQSIATNFSARVAYDKTMLYPSSGSVQPGNRFDTVTITGTLPQNPDASGTLSLLPFTAMLGEATTSPMNLVDFSWLDGAGNPADFDAETQSGTFTLLGICPAGGTRLYDPNGQVTMAYTPNPTSGNIHIDIQTLEVGRTQLAVMNLLGAKVANISDGELKPGAHTFDFNTKDLSAGSYFILLQTPTIRRLERIDVQK